MIRRETEVETNGLHSFDAEATGGANSPARRFRGVMKTKKLGTLGTTSSIGLGLMGMSDLYGPSDRAESIAAIGAAFDAGITLFDTGDFYGMGHNEMLLGEALRGHDRDQVLISVKFGSLRGPDASWLGQDNRPASVKTFLAYTLQRLATDHIDVYRPARLDPAVPIEDTVGAIAEMIEAGYVRQLGLSEVGANTIRRAHAVHPVSDLQIEYSLISRGLEGEILDTCRDLGIGITAYGVLSRGLISGHWSADRRGSGDFRGHSPRFSGDNLDHNLALVERLRSVASELGASVAQVAIAWVSAQGDDIVPLVGARSRERLAESLGAVDVELTGEQLAAIESAIPKNAAAGDRYDATQMAALDSER
jgi:aryl-alcohol dehydrogenase-like predicted oxidoreductase